jgi:hypothetical protein
MAKQYTASQTGAGTTYIKIDPDQGHNFSLDTQVSGALTTAAISYTAGLHETFNTEALWAAGVTWTAWDADATAAAQQVLQNTPITGVRIVITTGTGTVKADIVQS